MVYCYILGYKPNFGISYELRLKIIQILVLIILLSLNKTMDQDISTILRHYTGINSIIYITFNLNNITNLFENYITDNYNTKVFAYVCLQKMSLLKLNSTLDDFSEQNKILDILQ